jgi:holo-[acyl-carrier protein] synthase
MSRVLGVGVDLLSLSRIKNLAERGRFHRLILSDKELLLFDKVESKDRLSFLATRWASKESIYKAFYPTIRLGWKDLSILKQGINALEF